MPLPFRPEAKIEPFENSARAAQMFPRLYPRTYRREEFRVQPWDFLHRGVRRRKLRALSNPYAENDERDLLFNGNEPYYVPLADMTVTQLLGSALLALHSRRRAYCPRPRREPISREDAREHTRHDIRDIETCVQCYHEGYNEFARANRPYRVVTYAQYLSMRAGVMGAQFGLKPMKTPSYLRGRFSTAGGAYGVRVRKMKSEIIALCEKALCDLDGVTPAQRRARLIAKAYPPAPYSKYKMPRASRYLSYTSLDRAFVEFMPKESRERFYHFISKLPMYGKAPKVPKK